MQRWRFAITAATIGVIVTLLGFSAGLAVAGRHKSSVGQWLIDFSKSPGAAAVAAVIAASIAYFGISRQIKATRAHLDQQRISELNERWWQSFEWTANRGIPASASETALPIETSISTLTALRDSASTDVQLTACRGLIDELSKRLDEARRRDAQAEWKNETSSAAWQALSTWVMTSQAGAASSSEAAARLQEYEVITLLNQIAEEQPDLVKEVNVDKWLITEGGQRWRPDAVVNVNGVEVVVEVVNGSQASRRARERRQRLKGSPLETAPLLIVSPNDQPSQSPFSRTPTQVLRWRPQDGSQPLLDALILLARSGRGYPAH